MVCKYSCTSAPETMHQSSVSFSQGDRIYVVERINQDWWFVRKTISNQSGMLPTKAIMDVVSYTHFVTKSVDHLAQRLPSFEGESVRAPFVVVAPT